MLDLHTLYLYTVLDLQGMDMPTPEEVFKLEVLIHTVRAAFERDHLHILVEKRVSGQLQREIEQMQEEGEQDERVGLPFDAFGGVVDKLQGQLFPQWMCCSVPHCHWRSMLLCNWRSWADTRDRDMCNYYRCNAYPPVHHLYTHAPTNTPMHLYLYTHAPIPMHPCTHAPMHPCTHAPIPMHPCTYTHAPMHLYLYTHAPMHPCTHAPIPMHLYPCTHAPIPIHPCTYTPMQLCSWTLLWTSSLILYSCLYFIIRLFLFTDFFDT
ncbi:hypothetical protein B484DRAFT_287957 [Ochromonadaceae sp. CCMP2298]|nr:hypothetical protein B484DRAFT_287957 [Ochromonadaceae sp. CCMP2298]